MWILFSLIVIAGEGVVTSSQHSQEFNDATSCLYAKEVLDKSHDAYDVLVCLPKDKSGVPKGGLK